MLCKQSIKHSIIPDSQGCISEILYKDKKCFEFWNRRDGFLWWLSQMQNPSGGLWKSLLLNQKSTISLRRNRMTPWPSGWQSGSLPKDSVQMRVMVSHLRVTMFRNEDTEKVLCFCFGIGMTYLLLPLVTSPWMGQEWTLPVLSLPDLLFHDPSFNKCIAECCHHPQEIQTKGSEPFIIWLSSFWWC